MVTHKSKNNGAGNIALDSEEKIDRYKLAYRNDVVFYRREGLKAMRTFSFEGFIMHSLLLQKHNQKRIAPKTILQDNRERLRFHPEIEYVSR